MKLRPVIQAAGMLAIWLCTGAYAELYKCKGPDGKIVFSDTPCGDDTQVAKPVAAPAKSAPGGRYELTDSDRERIRTLESTAASANSEQRTAAQLEISNTRRGLESSLTNELRTRREALTAGLANADPKKRAQTLGELRTFYDR